MDKLQHYRRLFQYEAWANREVLANLKQHKNPPQRALKFLAHIIAAGTLWLERIKGEKQSLAVWPEFTLAQCEDQLARITQLWQDYLTALPAMGLSQPIAYTNTKGETFRSPLEDILTHVAMHGAYHRGQIATDTRAAGLTPVLTDFIHAARSGFV
ncbi:DinB family protein [candidate division KSB1 bacterium]|nr:DinB family protein [candidate division KSB1 bacterium]